MKMLTYALALPVLLVGMTLNAAAELTTFSFDDPKGVNGIIFMIDSELEPIVGMAGGITGTVQYDPAEPALFKGSVSFPVSQIRLVNDKMQEHMVGPKWLDAAGDMQVKFSFDEVTDVTAAEEEEGDAHVLTVKGTLSLGPASVEKTVNIGVTHLYGAAPKRGQVDSGDLLVLRSQFTMDRRDLGIENDSESVGPEFGVFVPIVGYSQH